MQRDSSIQDTILDKLQAERKPVTVVIINGFQIKGRISASDRHVVIDSPRKLNVVIGMSVHHNQASFLRVPLLIREKLPADLTASQFGR